MTECVEVNIENDYGGNNMQSLYCILMSIGEHLSYKKTK